MSRRRCEYHAKTNKYQIFIISPFDYPFNDIYKNRIEPLISGISYEEIDHTSRDTNKMMPVRADKVLQLGFIMCQRICRKIQQSDFVLADISIPNPNVYYELGLSYGLNKKIILIGNKPPNSVHSFGLINNNSTNAYIYYQSIDDLNREYFIRALKNPIINQLPNTMLPKSRILNITDKETTISGLHKVIFEQSLAGLRSKNKIDNDWNIEDLPIDLKSEINKIIPEISLSKICVIDTTIHNTNTINPYLFFCLGLSHSFEREAIPITHSTQNSFIPFDIKGLWHIFFTDLEQLKDEFKGILHQIDAKWKEEQQYEIQYEYFWNPFLDQDNISIITCGRNTGDIHRGQRTNIDKWDYKSVSELSFFLALKYPDAQVHIENPLTKMTINNLDANKINNEVRELLFDKSFIIIGSPDVNDVSEIVLAEVNNIEPYQSGRFKSKGYAILKKTQPDIISSFYWNIKEGEDEGIAHIKSYNEYKIFKNNPDKKETYGILTICDNPFVSPGNNRKVIVLSGFSGIATYGLVKLLTDNTYCEILKEVSSKYEEKKCPNVEILIKIKYNINDILQGDQREFIRNGNFISFISIEEI